MSMRKVLAAIAVAMLSISGFAQNCSCIEEYRWIRKTFEENDAGYPYYVQKYGMAAIDYNNARWEKAIAPVTDRWQCQSMLNRWIKFYRKGHLSVDFVDQTAQPPADSSITQLYFPRVAANVDSFAVAVGSLKKASFDGVWTNGTYNVGITRIKDRYVGFILSSTNSGWQPGQVKFSFPVVYDSLSRGVYYMGDHSLSPTEFEPPVLIGKTYLKAFGIYWKRVSPNFGAEPTIDTELSLLSSARPSVTKVDSQTVILRVPSFDNSYIGTIDSLVQANHHLLTTTKNLIIDIRGNGGGSDRCYQAITPLLYTNPIRTMWVEFLSTPLNNSRYEWISKLEGFSDEDRQHFREMKRVLDANIGKFVNLSDAQQRVYIDSLPEVYKNPQQVAVLIDGGNASTAEQFILMAKQSRKVKLYGQKTSGALDFSNLNEATGPSNIFKLWYTTSRSYRIPNLSIDDYGIQPDYYIDDSIPPYQWIEFVTGTMAAK